MVDECLVEDLRIVFKIIIVIVLLVTITSVFWLAVFHALGLIG